MKGKSADALSGMMLKEQDSVLSMTAALKPRTRAAKTEKPTSQGKQEGQYFSRAVGKALQILELIQSENPPFALNDIAKRIRLSKTSAFRLLRTLEMTGHLTTTDSGQYQLAPGMRSVIPTRHLVKLLGTSTHLLNDLSRTLRETVTLAALFENRVEVIAMVESQQLIRMSNVLGHILPPNASSLGKAIVAFQTAERREKLLRSFGLYRFTEKTILDPVELEREFQKIREERFATDREENVIQGECFGVPLFGPNDSVAAALSTSIPKQRVRDTVHEQEIIALLRSTAKKLTEQLYS